MNDAAGDAEIAMIYEEDKHMDNYVITINRQFGSLGRPIARKMSELLGIEYYDRDIVDAVAKDMNMPVSAVSDNEETARISYFSMKFPLGNGTTAVQQDIFESQRRIIANLADKENCIIVGRCSDYILRNHPNIMRIFIYAPTEIRYKNCVENLNMKPETAKKMIAEVDKARDAYHMHFAKYLPSDVNHNDIMINSSFLGIDGTAAYLVDLVKQRLSISRSIS